MFLPDRPDGHLRAWVHEEGGGEPSDRFVCGVMLGSAGGPVSGSVLIISGCA